MSHWFYHLFTNEICCFFFYSAQPQGEHCLMTWPVRSSVSLKHRKTWRQCRRMLRWASCISVHLLIFKMLHYSLPWFCCFVFRFLINLSGAISTWRKVLKRRSRRWASFNSKNEICSFLLNTLMIVTAYRFSVTYTVKCHFYSRWQWLVVAQPGMSVEQLFVSPAASPVPEGFHGVRA